MYRLEREDTRYDLWEMSIMIEFTQDIQQFF